MPSIKESINNKSLRIKSPCAVKNPVYSAPSGKIAFIISGSADCGKTSTVCYIAEGLRKYYGSRQVTAVLNETLCTAFGFSVKKYPFTRAASEPAGGVHNPPADDVVAKIKRIIP